ncbi:tetratricopeptide repeat protein 36 homolog isoform X2 [Hermetia illucens]|uniref:tetratricopeptide repeat protein 36 homolog isoform X2 n=1 Tax=Hermetia illucens TaxID=343691 RepID=UPI0018CC005E|nr:tetratricopeptide repeat protein 36 homolog isoform X2 [Hermetia illucens]
MPQRLSRDQLSEKDQKVLDSIFNPLQIGGNAHEVYDIKSEELVDPPEEQTEEVKESARLELEAVELAEKGDTENALRLFQQAIDVCPRRATLYNNRAQTYRLMGNDHAALEDLEKALQLSGGIGRTGCQALCQRGVLHRKLEDLDAARHDFEAAAKLGSKFARDQICNQRLIHAECCAFHMANRN